MPSCVEHWSLVWRRLARLRSRASLVGPFVGSGGFVVWIEVCAAARGYGKAGYGMRFAGFGSFVYAMYNAVLDYNI